MQNLTDAEKHIFLITVLPLAKGEESLSGIQPIITLSQSAHESNFGVSRLTERANNLFGMTAGSWIQERKPTYQISSWEHSDYPPEKIKYWNRPGDILNKVINTSGGCDVLVNLDFRMYPNWGASIRDWAIKISNDSRYYKCYEAAKLGDITSYASLIQQAGYGTDKNYCASLLEVAKEVKEFLGV